MKPSIQPSAENCLWSQTGLGTIPALPLPKLQLWASDCTSLDLSHQLWKNGHNSGTSPRLC
jgi:hypothetical protein